MNSLEKCLVLWLHLGDCMMKLEQSVASESKEMFKKDGECQMDVEAGLRGVPIASLRTV